MHNVCNVPMPHVMGDVISDIGIHIGIAAADSIGYRASARYWSNPSIKLCQFLIQQFVSFVQTDRYIDRCCRRQYLLCQLSGWNSTLGNVQVKMPSISQLPNKFQGHLATPLEYVISFLGVFVY